MKRRYGFTLVEMLIVITIILILMAGLVVLIKGLIDRARFAKTKAMVQTLTKACESYKVDFNVYPAGGTSMNLHSCLGRERILTKQKQNQGGGIVSREVPYVDFKSDWLEGNPATGYPSPPRLIVDAWEQPIDYLNPHPGKPANIPSFRIVAKAKDVADPADDVTSDVRDY